MEYLSQEGYDKIAGELDELIKKKLPEAIQAISDARDLGDLSENYEYRAAKRLQSRLLGRIRFLQRVLEHARVLPQRKEGTDVVQLLTKVEIYNMDNGAKDTYTIVSPHEADLAGKKLSVKSPVATALLGHRTGDVVEVKVPAGIIRFRIDGIGI